MARRKRGSDPRQVAGFLADIVKNARLTWRLFTDQRVSPWLKAILPATLFYLISPIDLFPDLMLGLGQLDDIAIILLAIKFFIDLCPKEVVQQHRDELSSVPGAYRHVHDEEEAREPSYIDASYQVLNDTEGT
ncbi:MAG: YkvA family protein [Anaerolineae bacterium]